MESIPILKIGDILLVSVQVDMNDSLVQKLHDDLTCEIAQKRVHGVLIDISAIEVVDSYVGRMLGNLAGTAKILDALTVVVGMRPSVAITMVELGITFSHIHTALNIDRGIELVRSLLNMA